MKTFFVTLLAALALCVTAAAQTGRQVTATYGAPLYDSHGMPLRGASRVRFEDVLKEPRKYADKAVIFEGVIVRVCKKEGCWMEVAPDPKAQSVRVTFKDHAFFVPKNIEKRWFRAEGKFVLKTLSKEEVEHLVNEDGAEVKRNEDGTADELTFVATGVELLSEGFM